LNERTRSQNTEIPLAICSHIAAGHSHPRAPRGRLQEEPHQKETEKWRPRWCPVPQLTNGSTPSRPGDKLVNHLCRARFNCKNSRDHRF
jgi:hypothetical protein